MTSNHTAQPHIHIIATGGTVAGKSLPNAGTGDYVSGAISVDALMDSVPTLTATASITCEQIASVGSEDMTEEVWFSLVAATMQAVNNPNINGVVILHGTDTMEETAYFLDRIITTNKPIIMTGAMRPADSPSADGASNILNAVNLAGNAGSGGYGVMVTMDDMIYSAQTVYKVDTLRLGAFTATHGALGQMLGNQPLFYNKPSIRDADPPHFVIADLHKLPHVEIIYGHAGQGRILVDAAVATGTKGIVHAGVGLGNVHKTTKAALIDAVKCGVIVVCASRVPNGIVPYSGWMQEAGFIASGRLNPQKARVLLQLAITRTNAPQELRKLFAST